MIEPFPLLWPEGEPQTPKSQRKRSGFSTNFGKARDGLLKQIAQIAGRDAVITSNVAVRRDGLPYASQGGEPENPGIAVYFWHKGRLHCMACDKWNRVKDNLRAIEKTLEAIRALDRWGASTVQEKVIQAFGYLPSGGEATQNGTGWWEILDVPLDASSEQLRSAYRLKIKKAHPDHGGSDLKFAQVQQAYEQAKSARGFK